MIRRKSARRSSYQIRSRTQTRVKTAHFLAGCHYNCWCRVPWINNTFKLPDLTQHVLFGRQHGRRFRSTWQVLSQHALRPDTLHLPFSLTNASSHKQVFLTAETMKSGGRSPMKHATNKT